MPIINVLDTQTSNLIAAGEVVERPSNAVKELIENSIDSGADSIVIEIKGGGAELIRVTDNGCGMSEEDLPLSVRRHATSKIKNADDLYNISTLGFRGEALAAISSTSKFVIMSKQKNDILGHQIEVSGETIGEVEECGCADGTTIIAKDLFFNQPARKKFLKREMTESGAVLQYVQRIAVSHPEISFKFISNGEIKLLTSGDSKLDSCIYSVYGKEFSSTLFPVEKEFDGMKIYGFATRPEFGRNTHSYQSFYINKRYVKSKTLQFALEDAYRSFVKSEKFAGCVLFLEIGNSEVDVNVHPAKLEVRFNDEKRVYNAVYFAVKEALEKLSNKLAKDEYIHAVKIAENSESIPEIKEKEIYTPVNKSFSGVFNEPVKNDLPLFASAVPKKKNAPAEEKPECSEVEIKTFNADSFKKDIELNREKTFEELQIKILPEEEKSVSPELNPTAKEGAIRGVIFDAYIIYETLDSVYLIDKHAAHERIIYERIKNRHAGENIQELLTPVIIYVNSEQFSALSENMEKINESGFIMEEFGDNAVILRGIPLEFVSFDKEKLTSLIEKTAEEIILGGKANGAKDKIFDRVLYNMACKAAVKAGIPSNIADHEWIISKLKELDNIIVCPHGRPIISKFTKKQIENLFLRD